MLLLLLGVGAAAGAAVGCPCIDVSALIAPNGNCTYRNAANPREAQHCYPPTYGSSTCAAHDTGLKPDCASNPLSYCAQQWCYVDAAACALSTYSTRRSDIFPGLEIFYSYETCGGSEEDWTSVTVTRRLSLQTLRVGIPALYYPQHFKYDEQGAQVTKFDHANQSSFYYDDGVRYAGAFIDFLTAVAARSNLAGINFTFVTLHSKKASESTQTRAVLDVNKGLVDVSATNFYVTSERASLTGFTLSLFIDSFYLWSARPREDTSVLAQFDKVFRPFDWSFWLAFGACMVGVGLLRPWLDEADSPQDSRQSVGRGAVAAHSLHATFMDVTSGGLQPDQWTPAKGTASMILAVGWGMMVIFTLAVYTANLAAYLTNTVVGDWYASLRACPRPWLAPTRPRLRDRWSSMSKAIEARAVICAQNSVEAELRESFPQATWLFSDFMELREHYNSGLCNAVVITLADVQRLTFMDDFICNATRGELVRSYEAVLKVPIALPAREHVAPALSYWIKTLYYETQQTYPDFERPYHRPAGCAYDMTSEIGEGALSLGVTHMSGVLLLLVASAVLAVIVKLCCTAADGVLEHTTRSRLSKSMGLSKHQSTRSSDAPAARRAPDDSDPVSQLTLGELRAALAADISKARTVQPSFSA